MLNFTSSKMSEQSMINYYFDNEHKTHKNLYLFQIGKIGKIGEYLI